MKTSIVILHGWGASRARWVVVKKLLEEKGFKVFVPDLPGFGQEPDPPPFWGLDEYAAWVEKECRNWGVGRCILIGHSFGGSVAVKLASNFPSKVEKLILVNSAGLRAPFFSFKMRIWRIAVRIGHFVFKLPILLNFYRFAREILYKLVGSTDYLKAQGAKKEILKTILRQDIKAILPFVKASTLIIWAEKDKQTPLRWAKIFEEAVPNSQLKIVKGAGHVFPYYNGQQFVDLITDFLFET